jgi:hypothetical protein
MVSARMKVTSSEDFPNVQGKRVQFEAVYSSDPTSPNYSWSKWTPSGQLSLNITNPDAYDQFAVGKTFELTFREIEDIPAPSPEATVAPSE